MKNWCVSLLIIFFVGAVNADICGDGAINETCSCGVEDYSGGYCCDGIWFDSGYASLGGCLDVADSNPRDGYVSMYEFVDYLESWKNGDASVSDILRSFEAWQSSDSELEVDSRVAKINPLIHPVMAGSPYTFNAVGIYSNKTSVSWDLESGVTKTGVTVTHTFSEPGIYNIKLTVSNSSFSDSVDAIIRVHTEDTVDIPQVILDTDAKNEQDDQHYIAYGIYSNLDILAINSIHHGGGQEQMNYDEIVKILDLAKQSGLGDDRIPDIYRGANYRMSVPSSQVWSDTEPIRTEASEAILAAVRGSALSNPVWIIPVGPGTNTASAILEAREEGLELEDRLFVMWLGGNMNGIHGEFNANNDKWSMYVVSKTGVETWIMPAPVGGRIAMDKRYEGHLYPSNPLGDYLKSIMPDSNKMLYDPACTAAVISEHLGLGWIQQFDYVNINGGPDYYWETVSDSKVRVIKEISVSPMKTDIFDTLRGSPRDL
jgi:PKD repeat protein